MMLPLASVNIYAFLLALPLSGLLCFSPPQAASGHSDAPAFAAPSIVLFANTVPKQVPFRGKPDGEELARDGKVSKPISKASLPANLYLKAVPGTEGEGESKNIRYKVFRFKVTLRKGDAKPVVKTFTTEGDVIQLDQLQKELKASDRIEIEVLNVKQIDHKGQVTDTPIPSQGMAFSIPLIQS